MCSATRLLAGFGVGLVFLAINRAASLVPDPVRLYGIMNSAGVVVAFLLFMIAPSIVVPYGLRGRLRHACRADAAGFAGYRAAALAAIRCEICGD